MTTRSMNLIYIVCMVVVVLFAVAFIGISALYFNSKKRLYVAKVEDPKIEVIVKKDLKHLQKKYGEPKAIALGINKKKKREKKASNILSGFLIAFYVVLLGLVAFAAIEQQAGGQLFMGDTAMLVIHTESMEEVYRSNQVELSNHNLLGEENRIERYSFVTLKKVTSEDELVPYKVYAFKMDSKEEGKTITIVHRLLDITEKDGKKAFTFRGDANPSSMTGEIAIGFDQVIGEWTGYKNLTLGMFIIYLQSGIGIITLLTAFMLLIIYSILYTKSTDQYEIRYEAILYGLIGVDKDGYPIEEETPTVPVPALAIEGKKEEEGAPTLAFKAEEENATMEKRGASKLNENEKKGLLPSYPSSKNVTKRVYFVTKKEKANLFLKQGEKKVALKLLSQNEEEGSLYGFYGNLKKGSFVLIDEKGDSPFQKKGYHSFISFERSEKETISVSNAKASLLEESGNLVYFLSKGSSFEALKEGEYFLTFRFKKTDSIDYNPDDYSRISIRYNGRKKGEKRYEA